jgi:serine/threonine protein kinase
MRKRRAKLVGTSYYLAPELLESSIVEAASDLWALGCIIYLLYYQ